MLSGHVLPEALSETATRNVLLKKPVLKNFEIFKGKPQCWSLFNKVATLTKETSIQVFSCEFCESLKNTSILNNIHLVKSVQIRRFFWPVFSCIRTEYGDLRSKSAYSVRI